MSVSSEDLIRDPLFQLNAVLWLTQPLPTGIEINPILHQTGFKIYAIAPMLTTPLDISAQADQLPLEIQKGLRPDVVLEHELKRKMALVECKASSFSSKSSTAKQARTLLIIAGPRVAEVMALDESRISESIVGCLLPEDQCDSMNDTLDELSDELNKNNLNPGSFAVLGLGVSDEYINLITDEKGKDFFGLDNTVNPFLKKEPDTDPRPLYFIPYDPSIDTHSEQAVFCRRILFRKIHAIILSKVGRSDDPPASVFLNPVEILHIITLGMYDIWYDSDATKHLKKMCKDFVNKLAKSINTKLTDTAITYHPREENWEIRIKDTEQYEELLDLIQPFSYERPDSQPPPKTTTPLFNNLPKK